MNPALCAIAFGLSLFPAILHAQANPVEAAVASVDGDRWVQSLKELTGEAPLPLSAGSVTLESRHSSSRGNTLAGTYIEEQLADLGFEVMIQTFDAPTGQERNIVAIKEGRGPSREIIVLGAHYDSTCQNSERCLGADDNGSGVATMLETARVISQYDTNQTIHFVAFGAEEQGLYGSAAYVTMAEDEGWDIEGAAIIDMVGWYDRSFKLVIEGKFSYLSWMNRAINAADSYSDVDTRRSLYSFGSDHIPFQQARIPAFLLIEQDWHKAPHYHTTSDTFDVIRPELGLEATRIMVGFIGDTANLSRPATATRNQATGGTYHETTDINPTYLGSACRFDDHPEGKHVH